MFPRLPGRATFVADTNFVSATNVSQFARAKAGNVMSNNVSATVCPRLRIAMPPPLRILKGFRKNTPSKAAHTYIAQIRE